MPVARPAYGRKPGPFVTAPDSRSKEAVAKAEADRARKAAIAVALTPPIVF